MVVETNDNLISIMSPVTAHFAQWADKAQNFPYMLNENDVVLEMNVTEARKTPGRAATVQFNPFATQVAAVRQVGDHPMQWEVNMRIDGLEPPAAPAPRRPRNF